MLLGSEIDACKHFRPEKFLGKNTWNGTLWMIVPKANSEELLSILSRFEFLVNLSWPEATKLDYKGLKCSLRVTC